MIRSIPKRCFGLVMVVLMMLPAVALAGEGFGMLRKRANLARIHPPQVRIGGSKISIRSSSQGNKYATAAQRMESLLESELLGSDPTLRLESQNADVSVDVNILQSDYNEKWEQRIGTRNVQTGNDEKGRPIYQARQMTIRYKVVTHLFTVAFKVQDVKSRRSLAADTIRRNFRQEYEDGNGAPDAAAIEDGDVVNVVNELTRRLTPTREVIGVLVPRGSMDNAVPYAEAGMWSKYLEALEKLPKLANPVDDSYRQYAMGVAYEALGYSAEDLDTSLKYLEQASVLYNSAAEANPKEKYFVLDSKSQPSILGRARSVAANVVPGVVKPQAAEEKEVSSSLLAPLARVQSALVQYQKMKELAEGGGAASSSGGGMVAGAKSMTAGGGAATNEPPADALTNDGVCDMLRAGLPESVIVTAIDSALRTSFDVSPKGLIQLAEAKASTKLIERIQAIANKKAAAKTQSSSPKPKATKKAS